MTSNRVNMQFSMSLIRKALLLTYCSSFDGRALTLLGAPGLTLGSAKPIAQELSNAQSLYPRDQPNCPIYRLLTKLPHPLPFLLLSSLLLKEPYLAFPLILLGVNDLKTGSLTVFMELVIAKCSEHAAPLSTRLRERGTSIIEEPSSAHTNNLHLNIPLRMHAPRECPPSGVTSSSHLPTMKMRMTS